MLWWCHLDGTCCCGVLRLNTESEELVSHRADLVRQLQAHKKYHQYMSKLLEASGDFHEISEIMSRYQTLLATYEVRCTPFSQVVPVITRTYTSTQWQARSQDLANGGRGRHPWVLGKLSSYLYPLPLNFVSLA